MDYEWLIVIYAVVTHVNLALAFAPSYWDPVKRNGRRLSTLAVPLILPALFGSMLLIVLVDNWGALPMWARVLGGFGVGASTATLVMNLSVLRALKV